MLYFAYTARIEPDQLRAVAPKAEFRFIAHLPMWGMRFPIEGNGWSGALPSVEPDDASTVWGAVFELPTPDAEAIDEIEAAEGRTRTVVEAMDRLGQRHQVVTHVAAGSANGDGTPSSEYVRLMLAGSRHWELPAGWIAGLQEHLGEI